MYITSRNLLKYGYGVSPNEPYMPDCDSEIYDHDEIMEMVDPLNQTLTGEEQKSIEIDPKRKLKLMSLVDKLARTHHYHNENGEESVIIPHAMIVSKIDEPEEYLFVYEYINELGYAIRGRDLTSVDNIDGFERSAINATLKYPKKYKKHVQKQKIEELVRIRKLLCGAASVSLDVVPENFDEVLDELSKSANYKGLIEKYYKIRDGLIEHNMRLVPWALYKKLGISNNEDYLSVGFMGLVEVIDKYIADYDKSKKYALSTFIVKKITYYGNRDRHDYASERMIRLPEDQYEIMNKMNRVIKRLWDYSPRGFSYEDIGKKMGLQGESVRELLKFYESVESYDALFEAENESLYGEHYPDTQIDFDCIHQDGILYDGSSIESQMGLIPTEKNSCPMAYEDPYGVLMESELKQDISSTLDSLAEREKRFIDLRFGLSDGTPLSFQEIGQEFGVSHVRSMMVVDKTLSKLRLPSRATKLIHHVKE